jgi:hypothetical protein
MKFNEKKRKTSLVSLVPAVFALSLAACGDGGGSSSNSSSGGNSGGGGKSDTGPTTGRLLDTAVGGVAYTASSGAAGNTDEKGIYKYNHGDTVEFKLGSLVVGKVKGAAIVTPIELAGDNANKLQNLLILFQSLDVDGNPDNGISIPAGAAAAITAALKLDSNPVEFAASAELQKAREAGGVAGAPKTAEQAKAHFLSQGISLLSTNIWVKHDDTSASIIRFTADGTGEYLEGEATPDDSCDANRVCGGNLVSKAGVEYGAARVSEFDTRGFTFAGKPVIDTNLHAGLSHPRPTWRIRSDGADLITSDIVTVPRERKQASLFGELFHIAGTLEISSSKEPIKTEVKESRFSKMENDPKGIVGAWALDPSNIKTETYLFFSNGKFMMIDPIGAGVDSEDKSCGEPGVEFASYSYDGASKAFNIKSFTYDTNGCAGFSGNEAVSFTLAADGLTAKVETKSSSAKGAVTLHRVSN